MLIFLAVIPVFPVSATVYTYDGNGNASSIQDLINTTANGDSVYLAGGTYFENLQITRSIVFGALDTNNLPEIVTSRGSEAGITLVSDGITINGIIISGEADVGLLVASSNNRVSTITVGGLPRGISLKSARNNVFSGNSLVNNSVGIELDRSSRSNTFYLNALNNTQDVKVQSADNTWDSDRQIYQYAGREYTGQVGNFWAGYTGTDDNNDGIGDTVYTIQSEQSDVFGPTTGTGVTDRAPLVSPPEAYTLVGAANPFNTSLMEGIMRPPDVSVLQQQQGNTQQGNQPVSSGPAPAGTVDPSAAIQNPFFPYLVQYWWVIPLAIIISAGAGIWFERKWRRRVPVAGRDEAVNPSRNITVVKNTLPQAADGGQDQLHYAAHLPPALERKYPDAE